MDWRTRSISSAAGYSCQMQGQAHTPSRSALRQARAASYESARPDLQAHVPRDARRILDLGCASGALGGALKRRQIATVVGIERSPELAMAATNVLDRVIVGDIDAVLGSSDLAGTAFDCLIAGDVLEHLVDPWRALSEASRLLAPAGTAVVSLPNVAYFGGWIRLVRTGRWPLDDTGVFDRTHLRWFTIEDGLDLLRQAGLRATQVEPRYWTTGWHLAWRRVVARTPAHRFLPPQYIFTAVKD
jgi:SAM-dependent methyltransferase